MLDLLEVRFVLRHQECVVLPSAKGDQNIPSQPPPRARLDILVLSHLLENPAGKDEVIIRETQERELALVLLQDVLLKPSLGSGPKLHQDDLADGVQIGPLEEALDLTLVLC